MMKIIAMIPARLGSNRLKKKNLLKINNKTLVSLCIDKCTESNCFSEIFLNTESEEIAKEGLGKCSIYMRDELIANHSATSENFVRDFLSKVDCDYLFQIHTIAPMIKSEDIMQFVHDFIKSEKQVGLCYEKVILETVDHLNQSINFSFDKKENSQDLQQLKTINWCMTGWKVDGILDEECLSFGKDRYFHEVPKVTGIVIKTMEDYVICKKIMEKQC